MKNRKIHLTRPKIDKKIFCKKCSLHKYVSDVSRKKNFGKSQFLKKNIEFSNFHIKCLNENVYFENP